MSKKKTAVKRDDPNPVFNEAMIFSVPAIVLQVRRGPAWAWEPRPGHPGTLGPFRPHQPCISGLLQMPVVCLKPSPF